MNDMSNSNLLLPSFLFPLPLIKKDNSINSVVNDLKSEKGWMAGNQNTNGAV